MFDHFRVNTRHVFMAPCKDIFRLNVLLQLLSYFRLHFGSDPHKFERLINLTLLQILLILRLKFMLDKLKWLWW